MSIKYHSTLTPYRLNTTYSHNTDPGRFLGNLQTFPDETLKCEISTHVDGEKSHHVKHAQTCGARTPIRVSDIFCVFFLLNITCKRFKL